MSVTGVEEVEVVGEGWGRARVQAEPRCVEVASGHGEGEVI